MSHEQVKVIANGTVVTSDGPVRADIVIHGERIAGLTTDAGDIPDAERIDAEGLVVVPGGIDVHTHFRVPDPSGVEGFDTGTAGALAGGITAAVEMPQATPAATTGEIIRHKIGLVQESSRIDIALWGGVVGQPWDDVQAMIDQGVVSLKAFMPASSPAFPNIDDAVLLDTFKHLAETGIPLGLHAESDALLQAGIAKMKASGRTDPLAHAESRPAFIETEAIHRAIFFAEHTGARLYICHCASPGGLALIKAARNRGVWVEVETCPQYLLLDHSDLKRRGPWARCAPAFRPREEVEQIWEYLIDGTIDVVSSDHAPYKMEDKEAGLTNIWDAPLGCNGVQTMFPGLLDEMVNKRGLGLQHFAELSSTNPARVFGLYPRKGAIQVGADADIVAYDLERPWTVRGADLLHRNKWTPFEDKVIGSSVIYSMVRGTVQYDANQTQPLVGNAGTGNFLARGYGEQQ